MRRRARGALTTALLVLLTVAAWTWPAESAGASCARIARSPHAFTGVVVATRSHDRIATVETDDGQTVEVHGGPAEEAVFSSVDRAYERGGRYEFHPHDANSPYQDDECTATRLLGHVTLPPPPPEAPSLVPAAVLAGLLVAVGAVLLLVRTTVARRR